jgi:hypothetical protein
MLKGEVIIDSVYTTEPSNLGMWNQGHWNYEWHGRSSSASNRHLLNIRHEGNGIFTIKDNNGTIWQVNEKELQNIDLSII